MAIETQPVAETSAQCRRAPRLAAVAVLAVLGPALAGCGSVSDGIGGSILRGTASETPAVDPAEFAKTPTCPTAEIRYGAEAISLYDGGKQGDSTQLRYQINVQKVARDCDMAGDRVTVRVGAAGRVVSGPKGATGSVSVPVRVAAVKGDQVLYSKLTTVTVPVNAPDYSANWSIVDDQVAIPAVGSMDTTIYVGLDGAGAKDLVPPKGKGKAKK